MKIKPFFLLSALVMIFFSASASWALDEDNSPCQQCFQYCAGVEHTDACNDVCYNQTCTTIDFKSL